MCTTYVPGAHRGQQRVLDPLEVGLEVVVRCHVGDGNQTQILGKNPPCWARGWLRDEADLLHLQRMQV